MTQDNPTYNQRLLKYSNRIAISLSILTVTLVAITGWYAWSTHRMVDIMAKDFEVSNRPYLAVHTMDKTVDEDGYVFWYSLSNNGKIPAVIQKVLVTGSATNGSKEKELEHSERSFVLQPGEIIRNDLMKISSNSIASQYNVKLTITYGTPGQSRAPYEIIYSYAYKGNGNLATTNTEVK